MVDNSDINFDGNRPKLKKVKRPVKKVISGGESGNSIPQKSTVQRPAGGFNAPVRANEVDAFNLDSYLDEPSSYSSNESQYVTDEDINGNNVKYAKFKVGNLYTINFVILISAIVFVLGIVSAKLFFSDEKIVKDGLQGVVINPEVPRGRPRCGVAEKTQGCVLYIMNPQRQELNARDFYDLAAQLTGRQKFVIETGNIRYSNTKIKPGAIAQINIPPLVN